MSAMVGQIERGAADHRAPDWRLLGHRDASMPGGESRDRVGAQVSPAAGVRARVAGGHHSHRFLPGQGLADIQQLNACQQTTDW